MAASCEAQVRLLYANLRAHTARVVPEGTPPARPEAVAVLVEAKTPGKVSESLYEGGVAILSSKLRGGQYFGVAITLGILLAPAHRGTAKEA